MLPPLAKLLILFGKRMRNKEKNNNKFLSRTDVQFTAWIVTVVLAITVPFVTYGNKVDAIEKKQAEQELTEVAISKQIDKLVTDLNDKLAEQNKEIRARLLLIDITQAEINKDIEFLKKTRGF